MGPESIPRTVVDAALRANLPFFGIACVALIVGLASLLLAIFRSRDRLLLWVGCLSVLYAVRLIVDNDLVQGALQIHGHELSPWVLLLTYLIPIPFALFARELFGHGWKRSISIWFWIEVAFAVVAIPTALFAHQEFWTNLINGVLVIGGTMLILLHVLAAGKNSDYFVNSLKWPLIIFGVLVVLTNRGFRPGGFNIEPVGFLILLAGLCSTAARHALAKERKLIDVEGELATARRIQSSIIPHSAPDIPPLQVKTRYQPMTSVAGDFFDFLKPGDGRLTILVADVSGHGVPAALVASTLKIAFAAQREQARDPAAVLAGLNVMLRDSLGGQYLTAACAAIDVEGRTVTYAGAGHPPSLLLRRHSNEIVRLAENGLFIGPFPKAAYSNVSVPFASGDKLLLYTDGITEAVGADGQEFGLERLERLLLNTNSLEPAAFVERLFREISTAAQQDDLTVVLTSFG